MEKIKVENNAKNVTVRIEDDGNRVIIEQMPEQVELIKIPLGGKFKVGNFVFRKIAEEPRCSSFFNIYTGCGCILEDFIDDGKRFEFGDNNNYAESEIRKYLNKDFYKKLTKVVDEDKIIKHTVDLMARDGLKDYGACADNVSLLTERMYQDYRKHLPKTGKYWWLATPWSTPTAGYSRGVCIVNGDGALSDNDCDDDYTVRPFCLFGSTLLVSPVDE